MEKNWDYDHLSTANCMHNLVDLTIEDCRGLKHLFSYSAIGSLSRLKHLEISRCEMMEEIIAPKGKNNIALEEVRFSKLETLVIKDMKRLKNVWHLQFESLKTLKVSNCGKLANIFPFELQGSFGSLEKLKHCSKLKHLVPSTVTCSQLTYLEVQNCNGLIHLITSSTAKSLVNLRRMMIRNCNSLEQVVAEDREESKDAISFRWLGVLELQCLPGLQMFCSLSDCLLELPWLDEVVISNCPRMEIFSLGKTDAPFLKEADQVVETTKQETPNLPSSSDDRQQKENASSTDPEDAVEESHDSSIGTQEMYDTIKKPSISVAQNVPSSSSTMNPDTVTMYPSPSQAPELATGQITVEESHGSSTGIQEMCDTIKKPSTSVAKNVPSSSSNMIPDAATMYPSPSQALELATAQSTGLTKGTEEMGENIERPMVEAAKISPNLTGVYNAAVGSQEIREIMDKPLIQSDQHAKKLVTTENTEESHDSSMGTQEMYDTMKKPSIPVAQNVPSSSSTMIPDTATVPSQAPELAAGQITEKSRDSYIETQNMYYTIKKPSSPTAQNVPNSTMIPEVGLAKGTRETGENVERPMVEAAKIALSPTGVSNAAVGSQEIRETLDKPLIQSDQHAQKLATIENAEKSRDSYIETQKMSDTIKKPSSPTKQNVPNSTMISDIVAIDPSSSKSPQPMTSTILESDAYSNDKWLNYISKQNLPHLEFGLKRHPQVLNWFNTKRQGVFAAIFTEVTRILRTTRGCDLTEDDQNYIRECVVALEAVGFDASWLNYVYGCIESCGNGDELIRKLEETEAKASTLRNELASVEVSLASMRDKASRLHNFIES
ncbi:hypothetical protein K1719_016814 [Acacia pycnantha]|nr:hypothetical protein K1719_016814 [Acacia pycnantha]